MSVRPFLSGQAFDPETIDKMSAALQSVCDTLSLKMVDGAATRLVARKIIELTQRGVRDAAALRAMTLKEFKYE
jgi:pentose-5-phosphate-3-epimerase